MQKASIDDHHRDSETHYGAGDVLAVPALTKDGRQISVEFTIVLLRGADRQIASTAAILRDVTRGLRRRAD